VFSSASIPGEIVDVLVVNSRTARERAPELRKLVEAWYSAARSVNSDPERAADSLASMTQLRSRAIPPCHGRRAPGHA
jgi:ABC-type nitrate/sulfonate/bicarbonate transport system substrate-binding protein